MPAAIASVIRCDVVKLARAMRCLVLVVLTCGGVMVGATPGAREVVSCGTDICSEYNAAGYLAACNSIVQRRRDAPRGWAVRLVTLGGVAAAGRHRIAAAPLFGHRLTNGQLAPLLL